MSLDDEITTHRLREHHGFDPVTRSPIETKKKGRSVFAYVLVFCLLYLGVLIMPMVLGKPVDKANGSFQPGMTPIGGRAVRLRAIQTIKWGESCSGASGLAICEIGPGRGVLAQIAKSRKHSYAAIDMDPSAISRISEIAAWTRLARVPPIPDMPQIDMFVCENVLEHMSGYQEAFDLVSGMYSKLRMNGCVVIRCPEAQYTQWGFWDNAQDHQYVTSLRRVTMLCREAGFHIERYGYSFDHLSGWKGLGTYHLKRCFPWRWMHRMFYDPWITSPYSKLADKVPHVYVVAVKD